MSLICKGTEAGRGARGSSPQRRRAAPELLRLLARPGLALTATWETRHRSAEFGQPLGKPESAVGRRRSWEGRHGGSARRNRNGSGVREESTPSSPPRRQVLSAVRLVLLPPLFLHRGSRAEGPLGSPDRGRDPWTPTPPLWVPQRLGPRASSQGAPGAPRGTDSGQRTGPP